MAVKIPTITPRRHGSRPEHAVYGTLHTTDLNVADVIEQALALAEANPDHIYTVPATDEGEGCLYMHGDVPGCIFGHAFLTLGADPRHIKGYEGITVTGALGIANHDGALGSLRTRLTDIQNGQDSGAPWGELVPALQEALRRAIDIIGEEK